MLNGPSNEQLAGILDEWLSLHQKGEAPSPELLDLSRMAVIALEQAPEPNPPAGIQKALDAGLYEALLQIERDIGEDPGALSRAWSILRTDLLPMITARAVFPGDDVDNGIDAQGEPAHDIG